MSAELAVNMERVSIPVEGAVIKAKVYLPIDIKGAKGIVVFTHGLGYCDRQYEIEAESFVKNGYLMVTYNMRGHAGTEGEWTLQGAVMDLSEVITSLIKKYEFENNHRICGVGHSTGALVTLLASMKDERIKFASLVTTVTRLRDSYMHWFKSGFNQPAREYFKAKGEVPELISQFMSDPEMIKHFEGGKIPINELEISHRYGMLKSSSWNRFFSEIAFSANALDQTNDVKIPLLLFRGEYDEVMDVLKTNELYEKLKTRLPVKLYITDSKNHFHNDRWGMIQKETLKFFDEFCDYSKPSVLDYSSKHLLVVDDDSLVVRTLCGMLRKNGFPNVSSATSGEEALILVKAFHEKHGRGYDFVIADVRMPGIDGIETIRRMKSMLVGDRKETFPFVFVTGHEGVRTQNEAKSLGYVDYFFKPIDMNAFIDCIKRHVSK